MKKKTAIYISIFTFLFTCSTLAGKVYKTKEKDGEIKYTNLKPKNEGKTVVEVKTYKNKDQTIEPEYELYPENDDVRLVEEKQNYIDGIFREKAEILYNREKSLKNNIESTKEYISYLENVIEDFLVNGYFADNYIFELRVQESNLKFYKEELKGIKLEERQLKKDARKQNVDPGILRVK